jgi:uncharacterized membrane protein
MTVAVVFVIIVTMSLPERLTVGAAWMLPALMGVLCIALIATDPGRITKESRTLRWLSIALVVTMVISTLSSTALLVRDLIEGASEVQSASSLLASGGSVWLINIVAFALLYWEFDCGGAPRRARAMPEVPDFAFPQQLQPTIAARGWRPTFVDYLYVGVTTSVAFSPTDTMPLAHWAKLTMSLQAIISLLLLGLVVARAVNVFQ